MIDFLNSLFDLISHEFGRPTIIRALVLSFLISAGLTQLAKFSPQIANTPDSTHRTLTRVWAFFAAFVPCWALWPKADSAGGVAAAIVMGLFTPTIYAVAVRIIVWKYPSIDGVVSARPVQSCGQKEPS